MAPGPTTVLITGATRGLGRGLLERFLALPNHTVIAGNRDPAHPSSRSLAQLPHGPSSQLIVVKIYATLDRDPFEAIKELQEKHSHMAPNAYGVLAVYQATRRLLQKSSREPIFASMGSAADVLARLPDITNGTYGPSKAVVNWLTIRINPEDPWLNAFVIGPGWVQTGLGNAATQHFGMPRADISVDESCDGMMKVFAETTKEKHGGKLVQHDGGIWEW